jgi:hypothetical protein
MYTKLAFLAEKASICVVECSLWTQNAHLLGQMLNFALSFRETLCVDLCPYSLYRDLKPEGVPLWISEYLFQLATMVG